MSLIRAVIVLSFIATTTIAEAPLPVEMVTARTAPDIQSYSLTGEIVSRTPLSASFPVGGRIAEVLVQEGDQVKKGMTLARMESVQQEQALRAAQAGMSTAQADQRQATEDLDRQDSLLKRGATTRISRDSAQDALRIAQGALSEAQAELDRSKNALSDTVLLAPMDATVTDRLVEPGQIVGAAQQVIELALGDEIDAIFNVPEVLMTVETSASEIVLALTNFPDKKFSGRSREVSPLVDPVTGTVFVTVSVIDPPEGIFYGDSVRGTALFGGPPHISIPFTAMAATADGPAVWVVDPDTMAVSLQQIEIDRFETGWIILAGGLDEGTLVVTRGAQLLYPGRLVRQVEGSK